MTTLLLHMGRPKTGTTSIQNFLHAHQSALLEQGILFPHTGRFSEDSVTHNPFFLATCAPDRRDPYAPPPTYSTHEYAVRLKAEIAAFEPRFVVMSDEGLFLPRHDAASLRTIRDSLGFREFRILVVLRQQSAIIESAYAQAVTGRRRLTLTPREYLRTFEQSGMFDYATRLREIEDVFGLASMRVCWFEDMGGDVLVPMFRLLGTEIDGTADEAPRDNQRMVWPTVRLMRWANGAGRASHALRRILSSGDRAAKALDARRFLDSWAKPYAAHQKRALDACYDDMNRRIRERYDCDWWREPPSTGTPASERSPEAGR